MIDSHRRPSPPYGYVARERDDECVGRLGPLSLLCVMNKERPGKFSSLPSDAAKNSSQVRQGKREDTTIFDSYD
jgi:hypothetical protein